MKTSTGIIDYHLKGRIEGQNSKITSTGRYRRHTGKFATSAGFYGVHLQLFNFSDISRPKIIGRKVE
jgi:hypothetical protein